MTRSIRLAFLLAALTLGPACGRRSLPPQGEVVLFLDTDAPLPSAPGEPPPAIPPLFDTVRVDLYEPGQSTACAGCTNVFPLDNGKVNRGEASLGILPRAGVVGERARVRLYPSTSTQNGIPTADATIDVEVDIPVVAADGVEQVSVFLHVDDVGAPVKRTAVVGPVTQGHAGTWPGAQQVPCPTPAPLGQVCVPGGAYWMGNPLVVAGTTPDEGADRRRIVVVSPFFLDATEVTVAAFRDNGATNVGAWTGSHAGSAANDWCTFTPLPSENDALPVNCVEWLGARAYCRARGGDLPTEAQFEYVAGGRKSATYVWGDDGPSCGDATYGLLGFGILGVEVGECQPSTVAFGGPAAPLRAGRSDRDQLVLAGGTVFDLAANVDEWVRDDWQPQGSPCWPSGVLHDPVCEAPAVATDKSVRGASWGDPAWSMRAATRGRALPILDLSPFTGFRCATAVAGPSPDAGVPPADAGPTADGAACVTVPVPVSTPTGPACAPAAPGACGVSDVSSFRPAWTPPSGAHQGLCTLDEISANYDACLGPSGATDACAAFYEAHAPCYECLNSYTPSTTYGPLVVNSHGVAYGNGPGCIALLEPCNQPCANAYLAQTNCEFAACGPTCPSGTAALDSAYAACAAAADQCAPTGCAKYNDEAACTNAIAGPDHPAAACFTPDFPSFYAFAAPLFCGP